MKKHIIMNGRYVTQTNCDLCNRVISIVEDYQSISKRWTDYLDSLRYFIKTNRIRLHTIEIDQYGKPAMHVCNHCINKMTNITKLDVTHTIISCMYTEDDDAVLGNSDEYLCSLIKEMNQALIPRRIETDGVIYEEIPNFDTLRLYSNGDK